MTTSTFSMSDLMDLLVARVGLPRSNRTDDPDKTLSDIGLDSLAFLQLQTELQLQHGVVVDESSSVEEQRLGELVAMVNSAQGVSA